jgi:hypothetical protein
MCGSDKVGRASKVTYRERLLMFRAARRCEHCGCVFEPPTRIVLVLGVSIAIALAVVLAGYEAVRDIVGGSLTLSTLVAVGAAGGGVAWLGAAGHYWRRGRSTRSRSPEAGVDNKRE